MSPLFQFNPSPPHPFFHNAFNNNTYNNNNNKKNKNEEEDYYDDDDCSNKVSNSDGENNQNQFRILDIVLSMLKKSLVTCNVEKDDVSSSFDISRPTEARHVSHVTFDRFSGFLGLPTELEHEVPKRVPSASAKVFGVSAKSMQCCYDEKGNIVPMILLKMQKQLYSEGGLKVEGIFRINAENSQAEFVRDQLNNGLVPDGIDVHCLSGLIKAWFRELPTGVLDSLTPEEVMRCNSEEDCTNLVRLLPSTEAALLDWAINLIADVVEHEKFNKMNAHNIAVVFAPNMTQVSQHYNQRLQIIAMLCSMQMADPLTALIHAVQVMNFLKTLILKTLQERQESVAKARQLSSCLGSPPPIKFNTEEPREQTDDVCVTSKLSRTSTLGRIEWCIEEKLWSNEENGNGMRKSESECECESDSSCSTPSKDENCSLENRHRGSKYDKDHWLRLRKGVLKLYRFWPKRGEEVLA
ncbi:unnamed protein product [Lupinus luteus]|uniref:Rho-GAP domain-containing protein n=1 Tax=Lupinus luteus TaxID=3873 RepID=A0AAV1VZ24_LUPLU